MDFPPILFAPQSDVSSQHAVKCTEIRLGWCITPFLCSYKLSLRNKHTGKLTDNCNAHKRRKQNFLGPKGYC